MTGISSRGQRSESGVMLRIKPTGLHETTSMWCVTGHHPKAIKLRTSLPSWCGVVACVAQFLLAIAPSAFISVNICCTSACCSATFQWDIIRKQEKETKHPHPRSQALQCTVINQQVVTVDQKRPVHTARCVTDTLRGNCAVGACAQGSLCEIISAVLFCKTSHSNL